MKLIHISYPPARFIQVLNLLKLNCDGSPTVKPFLQAAVISLTVTMMATGLS